MLINIWNTVYPILIAILCFELIIVIHEGGHFVAARMNGIKVNEFFQTHHQKTGMLLQL